MNVLDPSMELGHPSSPVPRPQGRELAMLGHDIRGALQGVLGGVARLEAGALPVELREQVDRVAASAEVLTGLVGTLLGDERDPAGASRDHVELDRFLRQMRRRYDGEARERGLGFEAIRDTRTPPALRLDPEGLARVVGNLVGNALRHAAAGSVRLTALPEAGGGIEFRVTDEGPGLPPDILEGALRAGPEGWSGGLGLPIVKALTDRLGGEVAIANRPAGGVEAVLRFPAEVCIGSRVAPPPAIVGTADLAGLHVLLAEDNPTNQMVATQMLKALRAEVTVCADGVEALEHFEREEFDLVVVDIEMPRLSGLDVIRAIRARPDARAQVPIVALTAYAMREHRDRIADAGADGLISKPITSVEALGRALAAHATARTVPGPVPSAAPRPDESPVVDPVVFDALCAAIGADMMSELLDKVISDLAGTRRDLAGALEPLDREPIRSASHILISVAGALGATRLHVRARTLNAAAHGEKLDGIEDEVRSCLDEIDAAIAFTRERRAAG